MFDTIKFIIEGCSLSDYPSLGNKRGRINLITEEVYSQYSFHNNFCLRNTKKGITVSGSLNKYYHGNNLKIIQPDEIEIAVNAIIDNLDLHGVPLILRRIDIGVNVPLDHPVELYTSNLLELPRYDWNAYNNYQTVSFRTNRVTVQFYDKLAEMKKKREQINVEDRNILRFEIQYKNRLKQEYEFEPTIRSLCDPNFINQNLEKLFDTYMKIRKTNILQTNSFESKTKKDFMDSIFLSGLKSRGAESWLNELELISDNWPDKQKSRAKSKILDTVNQFGTQKNSTLMEELDDKINEAINNYGK